MAIRKYRQIGEWLESTGLEISANEQVESYTVGISHEHGFGFPLVISTPDTNWVSLQAPLISLKELPGPQSTDAVVTGARTSSELYGASVVKVDDYLALSRDEYARDVDNPRELASRLVQFHSAHHAAMTDLAGWAEANALELRSLTGPVLRPLGEIEAPRDP